MQRFRPNDSFVDFMSEPSRSEDGRLIHDDALMRSFNMQDFIRRLYPQDPQHPAEVLRPAPRIDIQPHLLAPPRRGSDVSLVHRDAEDRISN